MYSTIIPANEIKQAVNTVFKVVPKGSSLRILDNIKISGNGKLEFYSTDLDAHGYSFVKIAGEGEAEISVNGKTFFNLCKTLPKRGNVEMQIDGETLKLNGASITGTDTRDFPGRPEIEREAVSGIVPTAVFREAFEKVAFAAAKDESRACLAGVLFHADKSGFELIATDGHRFAKKVITEYQAVRDFPKFSMIVPPLHVLNYLKAQTDPYIKITCHKPQKHEPKRTRLTYIPLSALKDIPSDLLAYKAAHQAALSDAKEEPIQYIRFNTRDSSLIVKLIEGPYPDYRRVIPANNPKSASFHRETLLSAVESLIPLANQKTHLIRFSFGAENSVSVINKEIGAEKTIPGIAKEYLSGPEETGEAFQIGFNAKYLAEILRKIGSEKVRFSFNTPIFGCIIAGANSNELFLLMPLRMIES